MTDLTSMRDHLIVAPRRQWVNDLNELYCQIKAAQAEAERHGFAGMAAALAEVAAGLARAPGVDPSMVRAFAGGEPADRTCVPSSSEPHGHLVTWH